jgi:hypothetical protein
MSLQFFQLLAQPSALSEFLHENRTALHAFLGDSFQFGGQIQGEFLWHISTLSRHSGPLSIRGRPFRSPNARKIGFVMGSRKPQPPWENDSQQDECRDT